MYYFFLDAENSQHETLNTSSTPITEPLSASDDEEKDPPCIVIYVVEPFTCGSDSPDLHRLACLALLRSYSSILNSVPESVRVNINFQVSFFFIFDYWELSYVSLMIRH